MRLLIAEIGSVHDGSFGNAKKLIEAAAACGAQAVKFQTHLPEAESLPNAPSPGYFSAESRIEYFRRTGFSKEQWRALAAESAARKVKFLSSPFSLEAVDLLEEVGIEIYKIPSGEVSNIPLMEKIAKIGKPVLLSSGMSNWEDLDAAVAVFKKENCPLTVLQCSSAYPCQPEGVGLNVMAEMKKRYGVDVGFSDHTMGYAAPIAAAALGATVIEKHFTYSRMMYGSDAQHSMEPAEFKVLAESIFQVWRMLDSPVDKSDHRPYADMKRIFEKSVVSAKAIRKGETLRMEHLAFKKPGDGIRAAQYREVIGKVAAKDIPENRQLSNEDFE